MIVKIVSIVSPLSYLKGAYQLFIRMSTTKKAPKGLYHVISVVSKGVNSYTRVGNPGRYPEVVFTPTPYRTLL